MHAHQDIGLTGDVTINQGNVLSRIDVVALTYDGVLTESGRHSGLGHQMYQLLGAQPVGHKLCYGDEGEPMLAGNFL
jgi:hypothetical protein